MDNTKYLISFSGTWCGTLWHFCLGFLLQTFLGWEDGIFLATSWQLFLGWLVHFFSCNVIINPFTVGCELGCTSSYLVITISNIMTAFLIMCRTFFIIHSFEWCSVADPAFLVMDGGAVLLVTCLVHVFTFWHVFRLALGLYLSLIRRVKHCFALPVTDFAATLLKECILHCAIDSVIWCPTFGTFPIVTTKLNNK